MVLYIYLDASYISELDARIQAGEYPPLGPKSNTPIQSMPPYNLPVHVACTIMINVLESDTYAELGGLFENYQIATSMRTSLAEMFHPKSSTQVATENITTNRIFNVKSKNIIRAIDMRFYWFRYIIR